jgi:hypothetical protein
MLSNDQHTLEALAAHADKLTGRGSDDARLAWALEICEWAFAQAVVLEIDDDEARHVAFLIVGACSELARDGIGADLREHLNDAAASTRLKRGLHKGPRAVLAHLMVAAGLCAKKQTAMDRIKRARKRDKLKKK